MSTKFSAAALAVAALVLSVVTSVGVAAATPSETLAGGPNYCCRG